MSFASAITSGAYYAATACGKSYPTEGTTAMTEDTTGDKAMSAGTRQTLRADARRADKMEPGEVSRTSSRWMGRTKGQPYSRQKLVCIEPAKAGKPAVFHTRSYTRKGCPKSVKATPQTIDWFFPSLPENLKAAMLGVMA